MTMYRELLQDGIAKLQAAGIEDAAYDAGELLLFAADMDLTHYLMVQDEEIPAEVYMENGGIAGRYRDLIRRRAAHVPLQHLTGVQCFYGLDFMVSSDVLIPRPETEVLVEAALKVLADAAKCANISGPVKKAPAETEHEEWAEAAEYAEISRTAEKAPAEAEHEEWAEAAEYAEISCTAEKAPAEAVSGKWAGTEDCAGISMPETENPLTSHVPKKQDYRISTQCMDRTYEILDLCTGSGCILITLLFEARKRCTGDRNSCARPHFSLYGTGADLSEKALKLAEENAQKFGVAAQWVKSDLFSEITGRFDLIVSNPPYIKSAEIETLAPEVRDYDPRMALDGGKDGLAFYRAIASQSPKYLKKGGRLILEIGYDQAADVSGFLADAGFYDIRVIKDLSGCDRVIQAEI